MKQEELKIGIFVRNIKHGNIEKVLHLGIMKMESGEWIDCVVYEGKDRFTNQTTIFCKSKKEFLNEFKFIDLIFYEPFSKWLNGLLEQLDCNVTDEHRKKYPYNIFPYSEEEIRNNMDYFMDCWFRGLSQYISLSLFSCDYGKKENLINTVKSC